MAGVMVFMVPSLIRPLYAKFLQVRIPLGQFSNLLPDELQFGLVVDRRYVQQSIEVIFNDLRGVQPGSELNDVPFIREVIVVRGSRGHAVCPCLDESDIPALYDSASGRVEDAVCLAVLAEAAEFPSERAVFELLGVCGDHSGRLPCRAS